MVVGREAVRLDGGDGYRGAAAGETPYGHHFGQAEDCGARVGCVGAVGKLSRGHGAAEVIRPRDEVTARVVLPVALAHADRIAILPVRDLGRDVDRARGGGVGVLRGRGGREGPARRIDVRLAVRVDAGEVAEVRIVPDAVHRKFPARGVRRGAFHAERAFRAGGGCGGGMGGVYVLDGDDGGGGGW